MAKTFDLQVHHYNKQGKVSRANPYRLVISNGKKEYERPPLSGMWYAEDGTLLRDESAQVKAKAIAQEAEQKAQAEAQAREEREALKASLREEILAEKRAVQKKASSHGSGSKA